MQNPRNLPRPRKPNREELKQLTEWYLAQGIDQEKGDQQEYDWHIASSYIAVFDKYQTYYPGFVGKLMVVVWGIAPSAYQVFTWGNELGVSGKITPLNQQGDCRVTGADRWD